MVKVFIAQTHQTERELLGNFLKVAGHDIEMQGTDALSRVFLMRSMSFMNKPFALVTSQRDPLDCDYISNLLQAAILTMPVRTLTIVYSRAVGNQDHMPGVVRHLANLREIPEYKMKSLTPQALQLEIMNLQNHPIKMVPKIDQDTVPVEHETILSYINREFAPANKP